MKKTQIKSWLIGLLILGTGAAHSRMIAPYSPNETVQAQQKIELLITQFYDIAKGIGVPSNQELQQLKPLITPSLYALLVATRKRENQCISVAKKDEKPDVIDQSLFSGIVEGFNKIQHIGPTIKQGTNLLSTITVVNDAFPGETMTWKNTIHLASLQGSRKIDDISFDVEHNVYKTPSKTNTLRKVLNAYLSQTKKSCLPKKHQSK